MDEDWRQAIEKEKVGYIGFYESFQVIKKVI